MFLFLCLCVYRNYMNDSLRTNVFVRFQAETIACACIYLAARALQVSWWIRRLSSDLKARSDLSGCLYQIPLPSRPQWYLLFGASEDEIKDICITTLRLYTRKKVKHLLSLARRNVTPLHEHL